MEVGLPVIRVSVTMVTTFAQAHESPARWRPLSVPHSRWSKRRKAVCSNTRMSQALLRLTAHASHPHYPTTPSSPCPVWCVVALEPPALISPLNAFITGTASKCSAPMTMMKTPPVLLLCLVSAAPALMGSPGQASLSPKTTCRQIYHRTPHSPRGVCCSIQPRRGSHWTGKQLMLWQDTPWSTFMTLRTCGVTQAWLVVESNTMWHLMWECRLSRCRDTRQPQLS